MPRYDRHDLSYRDLSDLRSSRSRSLSRRYDLSNGRDLSEARDLSRGVRDDLSRGRGTVRSLSDPGESEAIMAMTRRDASSISKEAVRDTDSFLRSQRGKSYEKPVNPIVSAIEIGGSAWLAGYLAQRYRGSGALLPIGVIAGLLGHVAAYYDVFGGAGHIRNLSNGAIGGALAIWGAGIGSLANENVQGPTTGNAVVPPAPNQPQVLPQVQPRTAGSAYVPVYAYRPPPAPAGSPHMAPSVADFQRISRSATRRAA